MLTRRELLKSAVTGTIGVLGTTSSEGFIQIGNNVATDTTGRSIHRELLESDTQYNEFFTARKSIIYLRNKLLKENKVATWDFAKSAGDTIREKSEHLIRTISHYSNEFTRIHAGPEVEILLRVLGTFRAVDSTSEEYSVMEKSNPYADFYPIKTGSVASRWTIYKDCLLPVSELLLLTEDIQDGILVKIANFVL